MLGLPRTQGPFHMVFLLPTGAVHMGSRTCGLKAVVGVETLCPFSLSQVVFPPLHLTVEIPARELLYSILL